MKTTKDKFTLGLIIAAILFGATTFILFTIRWMVDGQVFGDFAETLSFCLVKNPYNGETNNIMTIYPPFAFLPLILFALIAKKPISGYINGSITLTELCKEPLYILSFMLFHIICTGIILYVAIKITKFRGIKLAALITITLCFAPLLFTFFRANNIVLAIVFALLFFWLYDSEKRWQRELANLFLACCIGIKIYPALLLLYFIKDRRFMDMLKTFLYTLGILFVPFILIDGGFANIGELWNNFSQFSGEADRALSATNISIDSLASKISYLLLGTGTSTLQSIIGQVLKYGLILSTVFCMIVNKNSKLKIQPIILVLLTYNLFQSISYAYVFGYLIIPILFYIANIDKFSTFNKFFYGICFVLMGLPTYALFDWFILPQIVAIILAAKCVYDITSEFIKQIKSNKTQKTEEKNSNI
ncbi:MAG: DUF2029 domain-containing protein [Clostridia bacterium]|nr:DUF2029 domain-containing protein [Clostridia bacterium]